MATYVLIHGAGRRRLVLAPRAVFGSSRRASRCRLTRSRLFDSRRVEASRDGRSDGGHGPLPAHCPIGCTRLRPTDLRRSFRSWPQPVQELTYDRLTVSQHPPPTSTLELNTGRV